MKVNGKIALGLLMALTFVISGCGQARIGYIDGEKVMEEAPQIKTMLTEADQKIAEAQKELEEGIKAGETMPAEEAEQKQQEAQRKLMSLNQQYSAQLKHKLDTALSQIAAEKKLDVVVESMTVQKSVVQGGIDVTDEVIRKLQ